MRKLGKLDGQKSPAPKVHYISCDCGRTPDYLAWNDRLAALFFRPELAGRPVHLFASEGLIADVGEPLGATFEDFARAVKTGPPWATHHTLCGRALEAYQGWRSRGLEWPPYIAYLAAFVAGAGVEGEFAPNAYYSRLRSLLGEPPGGTLPGFGRMHELWEDLEQWSSEDRQGDLGVFRARTVGGWAHVGLPKAQTLLTEEERRALPAIFADAYLDPTSPPSDMALARAVQRAGSHRLRARTQQTLLGGVGVDDDVRAALLEAIADELAAWDGSLTSSGIEEVPSSYGQLRLACTLDRTAGQASMMFRCATNKELPDEEISFTLPGIGRAVRCEEESTGISTPIVYEDDRQPLDAAAFDWEHGFTLEADGKGWKFRQSPAPVRLLISAAPLGLPGLIETRQLPRDSPFYMLARADRLPFLQSWLAKGCDGVTEVILRSGIPEGWLMYSIARARDDADVVDQFPVLTFQRTAQIRFLGGIRADAGNTFFRQAPPRFFFEGGRGDEHILCNGEVLQPDPATRIYRLPANAAGRLRIEAVRGTETIIRRHLALVEPTGQHTRVPEDLFDAFGRVAPPAANGSPRCHGAFVQPARPAPDESKFVLPFHEEGRIYFVGRRPGQIVLWPERPPPKDWSPVWAIPKGRQLRALYCGGSVADDSPTAIPAGDRRDRRAWRELIWHARRRIREPAQPSLRRLWAKYVEVASRVR